MEGNIGKSMPSEKSVEIDLLINSEGARSGAAINRCPVNNSAKDCCSISDDEFPADDDCIVTLDQKLYSNHKMSSDCIEVDITAQDSMTDDDMQAEVSDLGLKIHDVCSLSSPSASKTRDILELIDQSACLAPTIEAQPRPVPGTPCAKKSAGRSVVHFFEQEYNCSLESTGDKSLDWHRNGKSPKWQPVVPLVDVMKRPSLHTIAPKKRENPLNNEEEDCVVIENDSKTQDVIVLDDLQDSNSATILKPTCSAVNHDKPLSSNCYSLSPKAKSSLKRPTSPLREDGLCRKVPRTEFVDDLLILDSPASALNVVQDNSFEPHNSTSCGDSEISVNQDFNHKLIHIVPDMSDLNGDCAQVSQSCVQRVGNHRAEDEKRTSESPAASCKTTNDHVSASTSKIHHGFSQMGAASLSSPTSGLASVPSAGESSWIKGETYLVDYPCGLCVQGVWDGFDFQVSGSFMKKQEPAKPCKSAGELDAQAVGQPLVVRYPNGLTVRGVWDGFCFSVAPPLDAGNPMLAGGRGGTDKETHDADSSSGVEVSSNMRLSGLVSYDLSDTDDSRSSNGNLNVTSTCPDVTVISQDCDSRIVSMTSTTQCDNDDVMPLELTSCSTSEAMSTKTFYGSSASRDDVFPKQYSARHGQHKGKKKRDVTQSIIEDVVHISSDEDDTPKGKRKHDKFASGRKNCGTSHDKEKSTTPPKSYEEPAQSCTMTPHKRTRRKSADCIPLDVIKPTKIIYRTKTCVPRECLLTPDQLSISVKKGSFSFDVGRFVLGKVKDGRIVFRIPIDAADILDDMLGLPPEFNPGITSMNSRLTLCIDESTPTSILLALLEQIKASEMPADDPSTIPENEPTKAVLRPLTWVQNISKAVRKRVPKKLASWTRPKHWNKPFFKRYGEPRIRVNFRGHSDAAYDPVADDAFVHMDQYDPYYEMQQQPIQVSGFSGTVIKLFTYPPPPIARGIAVTNEDLFCLNAGEYVNDVIIDFYLKYLFNEVLSAEDRARTHIFSSFFYGHLISVTGSSADPSSNLSLPEQRHQKVRTWTRHVDIFSKDFIIVPINENYHWFLAIICFPSLCPETKTNDKDSSKATEEKKEKANKKSSSSDASAATSDESNAESKSSSESNSDSTKSKEVVKNPCVLIFDSLQGDIRWDVSRTLREYLKVEWEKKKAATEGRKTFDKDVMKGCRPPCPQQPNYSDCGLYLLQYVEAFFKKPLKDFTLPIRYLRNWFDGSEARAKRSQLRTLILELKDQLNPDLEYDPIADGCCNDVAVTDFEAI